MAECWKGCSDLAPPQAFRGGKPGPGGCPGPSCARVGFSGRLKTPEDTHDFFSRSSLKQLLTGCHIARKLGQLAQQLHLRLGLIRRERVGIVAERRQ